MRLRSRALLILLAALFLPARPAASDEFDRDDRKWLDEVQPIMLSAEEKFFRELKAKEDRLEFRRIFWARRDPDPQTPENEFEAKYAEARAEADILFRGLARPGSRTDCGRVFILLGKPDDVQQEAGTVTSALRTPEVWTYRSKPGQTFEGGAARLGFDSECRSLVNVEAQLDQVAASRVVRPGLEYRLGEDGRLVSLEDQLPRESPAAALVKEPRQDFPLALDVSYLRVSDETTGVVGLVRGQAPDLPVEENGGARIARVVVVARAVSADGDEAGGMEQPIAADVRPEGAFVASFGLAVPPGTYTLTAGAVVEATGAGSAVSQEIEAPDFSKTETAPDGGTTKVPSVASILFVREIQDLPPGTDPDPEGAYAAFQLGPTRLVPYFGRDLKQSDSVSFFYAVYDLEVDPATGNADAVAAVSLLRDGKTVVARAPENPLVTAMAASAVGPIPLEGYQPGSYVVQLRVTDRTSGRTAVRNERFRVVAPEAE